MLKKLLQLVKRDGDSKIVDEPEKKLSENDEDTQPEQSKFYTRNEKHILKLSEETGMNEKEAERYLKKARKRLGIKPRAFMRYRLYLYSEDEQKERAEAILEAEKARKERNSDRRSRLYERIAADLGCTVEEAKEMAARARDEYEVRLQEYVAGKYYNLNGEEIRQKHLEYEERKNERIEALHGRNIEKLMEILDVDAEEAEDIFASAKERLNIGPYLYLKYKLYEIPEDEQKERMSEIILEEERNADVRQASRNRIISRVVMRTGWSRAKAEQAMIDAYKNYSITFNEYLNYGFFRLTDEEQQQKKEEITAQKEELLEREKESCIEDIMTYRNCSREEAEDLLEAARKKTGVSYRSYRRYRFYEIPEDKHADRIREIREQLRSRTQVQIEDNDKYLEKISDETGWENEETLEKLADANSRCGASWKDFYAYEFWELTEEEQCKYFTVGMQKALSMAFDELQNRDIFVNKENFLEQFASVTGRKWCVSNTISAKQFKELFGDCSKVLYKPSNNGNAGSGIEVFEMDDPEETYARIQELPRGIVEEYLIQHHKMSELYPYAVNTIRVASVCWKDEDSGEDNFEIAYASLRMGAGGSNVDNFTTGGMVANVDLATGTTLTAGVNVDGVTFPEHPDTGFEIKGFTIPYFKEGLELVKKAGSNIHGYIGWDVAITEKGPVLIEANVDPGNRLLQIPWVPEKRGMAHVMNKYLEMTDFFEKHPDYIR